jgi:putative transposase
MKNTPRLRRGVPPGVWSTRMLVPDPESGRMIYRKRRRRFDEDRSPRELTFSCYRRLRLLDRDRTRRWFVEALEVARREWPIDIWAYVIMPEHVHLLVSPREKGVDIGAFQGRVKSVVAKTAIHWLEENAPQWLSRITVREGAILRRRFWQPGGGYDRNIVEWDTLANAIEYIHPNPVRRRLVKQTVDWEWSSARWYAGLRPVPIDMDATLPMGYE